METIIGKAKIIQSQIDVLKEVRGNLNDDNRFYLDTKLEELEELKKNLSVQKPLTEEYLIKSGVKKFDWGYFKNSLLILKNDFYGFYVKLANGGIIQIQTEEKLDLLLALKELHMEKFR